MPASDHRAFRTRHWHGIAERAGAQESIKYCSTSSICARRSCWGHCADIPPESACQLRTFNLLHWNAKQLQDYSVVARVISHSFSLSRPLLHFNCFPSLAVRIQMKPAAHRHIYRTTCDAFNGPAAYCKIYVKYRCTYAMCYVHTKLVQTVKIKSSTNHNHHNDDGRLAVSARACVWANLLRYAERQAFIHHIHVPNRVCRGGKSTIEIKFYL